MINKGKICKKCKNPARARGFCLNHYRQLRGIGSIKYMHKARFGGLREIIILRDKQKCVICGMTRKQHKRRWGRDITIDHIDGKGRNSRIKNNLEKNLQTLCLICHGRKDRLAAL